MKHLTPIGCWLFAVACAILMLRSKSFPLPFVGAGVCVVSTIFLFYYLFFVCMIRLGKDPQAD